MFLRNDSVRGVLQSTYDGPYEVIERGEKNFVIKLNKRKLTVNIDRLKPAYVLANENTKNDNYISESSVLNNSANNATDDEQTTEENNLKTRSGRKVRFPDHLQAGFC